MVAEGLAVVHHSPVGPQHSQAHIDVFEVLNELGIEWPHFLHGFPTDHQKTTREPITLPGIARIVLLIEVVGQGFSQQTAQSESPCEDRREGLETSGRVGNLAVLVIEPAAGDPALGMASHEADHLGNALLLRLEVHVRIQQKNVRCPRCGEDAVQIGGIRQTLRVPDNLHLGEVLDPRFHAAA